MIDTAFKDKCIATAAGLGTMFGLVVATGIVVDAVAGHERSGWLNATVMLPTCLVGIFFGERVYRRVLASRQRPAR